jgi:hypothetical protein
MKRCHNCQTVIDEYLLDRQLDPLRERTVDDFNLCADCVTIVADACVECAGAVYVPRSDAVVPDYCPTCRSDLIARTDRDPGWTSDGVSS